MFRKGVRSVDDNNGASAYRRDACAIVCEHNSREFCIARQQRFVSSRQARICQKLIRDLSAEVLTFLTFLTGRMRGKGG